MFVIKQLSLVLLFLSVNFTLVAQTVQEYKAVISHTTGIQVNDISYIHWGCVDKDFVRLDEMTCDGVLSFCIENTVGVDVGLAYKDDVEIRFGFRFLASGAVSIVVVDDILQPVIYYSKADQFKIIKSSDGGNTTIKYFKNDDLLYSECIETVVGPLIQLTTVDTDLVYLSETQLDVVFENNDSDCDENLVIGFAANGLMTSGEEDARQEVKKGIQEESQNRLNNKVKGQPNKIVSVNIHNDGKPVKSYRIRTDANGEIPKGHEVHTYLNKGYQIKIRRD